MPDPASALEALLRPAFDAVEPGADPVLRRSDRADYQANGVLALAKRLGRPPREVAAQVCEAARLDGVASVEVAGPGFLNLTVDTAFLTDRLVELAADARLGVPTVTSPWRVALDWSSPNIAKEMHVGHLRGTILGDALRRLLTFSGHEVLSRNHVGDWGTPFGMLLEHLVDLGLDGSADGLSVSDLDEFYKAARAKFDADDEFAARSRARVVALQGGDAATLALWRVFTDESLRHLDRVYRTLGVEMPRSAYVGESHYNAELDAVVTDLDALGLLVEDDGALCVFPDGFTNREGAPLPLIVRKSDGGYGYASTDLAALRDRVTKLRCDHLLYVVGATQAQHFEMVFAVARAAGWLADGTEAEHVAFGNILGTDHKLLRSRSGEAAALTELLDEAITRAGAALDAREAGLSPDDRAILAEAIGIGAVKYADLSTERLRDYVLDFDRLLSFEGDTGPYLAYAHARIRSIFRRLGREAPEHGAVARVDAPEERALALELCRFPEAIRATVDSLGPHRLCAYLSGLAQAFTGFYEHCPVLRAGDAATTESRLVLCDLTSRTLALGLDLLGIEAPERM
jgi:arginyl-tRNA synthetase